MHRSVVLLVAVASRHERNEHRKTHWLASLCSRHYRARALLSREGEGGTILTPRAQLCVRHQLNYNFQSSRALIRCSKTRE